MSDSRVTSNPADSRQAAAAWVSRVHSGEMSAGDEASLLQWLDEPGNRSEYALHLQLWSDLDGLRQDPAIQQVLTSPPAPAQSRRPWMSPQALGAIAATLVMVIVGAFFLFPGSFGGQHLVTEVGEIRTVQLTDGSRVTLNTATRLRVHMTDDVRSVEFEQGEAFFAVSRDPARPFLVHTSNGDVRVLGTQFNVRRTGRLVEVMVEEGHVEVRPKLLQQTESAAIQLTSQQKLVFSADSSKPTPVEAPAQVASWRTGEVIFRQDALIRVVNELGRYTTKRLVLDAPQLAEMRVSGVFRPQGRGADVEGFVIGLEAALPIRATVFADHITIEAAN